MYVLEATKETQGERDGDYVWTIDGELAGARTSSTPWMNRFEPSSSSGQQGPRDGDRPHGLGGVPPASRLATRALSS